MLAGQRCILGCALLALAWVQLGADSIVITPLRGAILGLIIGFLFSIYLTLLFLMLLLMGWLARLLFGVPTRPPTIRPQQLPLLRELPPVTAGPPLLELIRSFLFWALVLGIVGYSLRNYIQYRRGLFAPLLGSQPWRALLAALRALWQRFRGAVEVVAEPLKIEREVDPLGEVRAHVAGDPRGTAVPTRPPDRRHRLRIRPLVAVTVEFETDVEDAERHSPSRTGNEDRTGARGQRLDPDDAGKVRWFCRDHR